MSQYNIKQVKGSTQGSILFLGNNGIVSENNFQLFWSIANNALIIGTTSLFGTEKFRIVGDQRIDGNLVISGSFSVLGSASVINTQNLQVQDPIILLASTQSGAPALDSGIFINRGTGATQGFIWDESAAEFSFIQTNDGASTIGNVNISSYAKIRAGGLTVSQINITSGAANNYVLISNATGLSSWTSSSVVLANANGVTGSGTTNYVPRWLSSNNLSATGSIYDDGSFVGIGTASPNQKLSIYNGNIGFSLGNGLVHNGTYTFTTDTFNGNSLLIGRGVTGTNQAGESYVALGALAHSTEVGIAIGNAADVREGTFDGIAIGRQAIVSGGLIRGIAIGRNANVRHNNAWAIGYNAITTQDNEFNFGASGTLHKYTFNGQVGIGTASSTTLLHINATQSGTGFRLVDTTQGLNKVLVSDANGVGTWTSSSSVLSSANGVTGSGTSNYVPRWISANNLSATGSIYDSGARIGVGIPSSLYTLATFNNTRFGPGGTTVSKVFIDSSNNTTYSTVLFVEGPNSNSVVGGHVAYFRRNLDAAGTTASVLTLEHTNRAGSTIGASTFRTISGYAGKLSQFQALSSGMFSMGNTYSSGQSLLTLTQDTNTFQDPGNADRWMFRGIDNMDSINTASNRYGISVVMGGTFAPQAVGSTRLYGIYSDVSGVGSTSSTASVIAGVFLGGNVGVGLNNPAARLHVSGTSMTQPLIIASGSTNTDLVRITQNGTGNSFVVEDPINPDSTQFVIDAIGNVGIGLTAPSVKLHVTESTRVTRFGTYSYLNLGISNVIDAQYFTNSISAASSNVSIVGTIRPMGLTTNSLSTNAGVLGLSYWDRDTSVGLGNANLLSSSPVLYGTIGQVIISATGGTVSVVAGVSGVVANQLVGVTVSNMFAFRAAWNNSSANNGYTGNYAAFYMPNETTNAPNIGNKYGIYIDDPNAANVFLGNMAVGTTTSAATSTYRLTVSGTVSTTGFRMTNGAVSGYVLTTDANGVGTWQVASGGGLTANNGLSYSNGIVGLGGSLVRPTLITNGSNAFTMSTTTSNIEFFKFNGFTFSFLLANSGASIRAITSLGTNSVSVDDSSARIQVRDVIDGSSFSYVAVFNNDQTSFDGSDVSTNNRMVVRDDYYSKGLVYYGDYSANFTNNPLVTKAYVTSAISTTGSGTTNYGARWVTSTQLGTGSIYDSGTAVGIATQSNGAYALNVLGDVNILGTLYATSKSFEITHPLDSTKRLTYGSLEGPEYGVYYRGRLNNESVINLPDYWSALVDENSITVDITPIGMYQRLFVDKIENNKVYIGSDNSGSPTCYYVVYAERKDIPKIIVEQ